MNGQDKKKTKTLGEYFGMKSKDADDAKEALMDALRAQEVARQDSVRRDSAERKQAFAIERILPIMYEGRAPEATDYAVAGGILMGLKLPGAVFGRAKTLVKQRLSDEIETTNLKRQAAIDDQRKARREGRGPN